MRELLKLDLRYYSSSDPSVLDDIAHKVRVGAKQVVARPGLLFDALRKLDLRALWIPDKKRILIDEDTPKLKHRWIEGHEISHGIIPWHSSFMFGDNKQTLNPDCDVLIEAEANYSAGRMLFLGNRFGEEARSLDLSFKSIKSLKSTYGNSLTSTLWRVVEEREPGTAVFGMISGHPRHSSIGKTDERFIRSAKFREQFGEVKPGDVFDILRRHASYRKTGPVLDATDVLVDDNGETFEFRVESFSNSYDLLTYGVCIRKQGLIISSSDIC